jgi:hypothetical protein
MIETEINPGKKRKVFYKSLGKIIKNRKTYTYVKIPDIGRRSTSAARVLCTG